AALGDVRLTRGASLSGRVSIGAKLVSPEGVIVDLIPASYAWSASDLKRVAARARGALTNGRGFFQFRDIEPGSYRVVARQKGWSPAEARDVVVAAGAEEALRDLLTLEPLRAVAVTIDPRTDPKGRPWHVALRQFDFQIHEERSIDERAAIDGQWKVGSLERGGYALRISDADGTVWHNEQFVVDRESISLQLKIEQVAVEGKVLLGSEPIAARLVFHNAERKEARFNSDEEGAFNGVLPSEGPFFVEVSRGTDRFSLRDVDVRLKAGEARAQLDLRLPEGRLRGHVVDDNGEPVAAALSARGDHGILSMSQTATDGSFEFSGLPTGDVQVRARNATGDSGFLTYHINGGNDSPVTIKLPNKRNVRGVVRTMSGGRVAGAIVRYYAPSVGGSSEVITGPNGEFDFQFPSTAAPVDLIVMAANSPVRVVRVLPMATEKLELVVGEPGGMLIVAAPDEPWPFVGRSDGYLLSVSWLAWPPDGERRRMGPDGFHLYLEPGEYTVCNGRDRARCVTKVVAAGAREAIDVTR
ncbi:MAG: hypothetical protein JWO97_167, partial [Acidobacteria bacterium]|nr:hypothetical protein [Acidobacteriota bacterium]